MNNKLQNLITAGESQCVEFKSAFHTDVIETAVAFANTSGGHILIGLSNTGQLLNTQFGMESLRDYVNRIATATEPSIHPEAKLVNGDNGTVIILSVQEFPNKPVSTRGRCFVRSGSTTRQMMPSEIAEMHLHSTGQSMDAVIVPGKSCDDLDFDAVHKYMRKATERGRRSFSDEDDPWQVLRKLELVKSEHEITRAAILLFGKAPQSPLSQAVVHAGRLRDKTHIMDNLIITGSIINQVDETINFIKKNLHVRFEINGEPERKEIWDYPPAALREAVVNAICHRDYGDTTDIQIKIFEDALQVWSPGSLPYNMDVDELMDPEHSSKPRNKLVAQVFYDLGLIERYGSGIQRILDACSIAKLPKPLFENVFGGFRIKFMLRKQASDLIDTRDLEKDLERDLERDLEKRRLSAYQRKILEEMRNNPFITQKELANIVGITDKNIRNNISKLKDKGLVKRIGPDNGGHWKVLETKK